MYFTHKQVLLSQQAPRRLAAWLARSAQHVTEIQLVAEDKTSYDFLQLELPFQQLSQLRSLRLGTVELLRQSADSTTSSSSSSAADNPMAAMSQSLTTLELSNVIFGDISDSSALMQRLAALTSLQRLQLSNIDIRTAPSAVADTPDTSGPVTLPEVLLQLTQLTSLALNDCGKGVLWQRTPCSFGAALAGLQQLQQLELHDLSASENMFDQLPESLTLLKVSSAPAVAATPVCMCCRHPVCMCW
jgi:hypothetical protein